MSAKMSAGRAAKKAGAAFDDDAVDRKRADGTHPADRRLQEALQLAQSKEPFIWQTRSGDNDDENATATGENKTQPPESTSKSPSDQDDDEMLEVDEYFYEHLLKDAEDESEDALNDQDVQVFAEFCSHDDAVDEMLWETQAQIDKEINEHDDAVNPPYEYEKSPTTSTAGSGSTTNPIVSTICEASGASGVRFRGSSDLLKDSEQSHKSENQTNNVASPPTIGGTPLEQVGGSSSSTSVSMKPEKKLLIGKLLSKFPLQELKLFRARIASANTPQEKMQLLRMQIAESYLRLTGCKLRKSRGQSSSPPEAGRRRVRKRDVIRKLLRRYGDWELVQQLIEDKKQEPRYIKFFDKVSFTCGILNVILLCYFIFGPRKFLLVPYLYTLQWCVLMPCRIVKYRREKNEYFLWDFCYSGNLLLLLYLWAFPDSPTLFCAAFGVACGPLLMASTLFRNSLVFHSWEHCTSVFIHVMPFLCCYLLRHESESISSTSLFRGRPLHFAHFQPEAAQASFFNLCLLPLLFYICQQVVSYIAVYYIWPIPDDPSYLNLYRWVSRAQWAKNILNKMPGDARYHEFWYIFLNVVFAFVTMVPTILWYQSKLAMVVLGIVTITVNIWNGASFYVEVFSRKYQLHLKQQEELRTLRAEKQVRETQMSGAVSTSSSLSDHHAIGSPSASMNGGGAGNMPLSNTSTASSGDGTKNMKSS
ncbi:unnamed protein product [Amoebophrya sp. A25]|nr:unnamed protein product [Amoebophrya sp. A25]|eukprot:GSA25T00011692001.1